jgi:hypothetical protein
MTERMTAQEVKRGQLEGAVTHAAFGLLENLCPCEKRGGERNKKIL